jgi:polyisoprenyl-teichoic acid--peptidoglycan teichoic acid transferase
MLGIYVPSLPDHNVTLLQFFTKPQQLSTVYQFFCGYGKRMDAKVIFESLLLTWNRSRTVIVKHMSLTVIFVKRRLEELKTFLRVAFFTCLFLLAIQWYPLLQWNSMRNQAVHQNLDAIPKRSVEQSDVSKKSIPIGPNLTGILLDPLQSAFSPPKNRVVLCLGVDSRNGERARADTILLAIVHPKEQRVTLISIPRDTHVYVPGFGMTKLNHAIAYGGIPLIKQTIERWLGIHIDNYAEVNFKGLRTLVDQLGGVDLLVEKDMDYVDPTDGTAIHLKAGYQHLNGKQALDYTRFRHDILADTGRMGRQQVLVRAMMHTGLKMENWPKLIGNLGVLRNNLNTDLPFLELVRLARQYSNLKPNAVDSMTISGVNRVDPNDQLWYFYPNPNEAKRIAQLIKKQISS